MASLSCSSPAPTSHLLKHSTAPSTVTLGSSHLFGAGLTPLKAASPLLTPALPSGHPPRHHRGAHVHPAAPALSRPCSSHRAVSVVAMANVNEGKGLLAPVVVGARRVIGPQRFNQLRGRAIQVHAKAICGFCDGVHATPGQRQDLIRMARRNGERLGFLA